jgi:hypothetical protein
MSSGTVACTTRIGEFGLGDGLVDGPDWATEMGYVAGVKQVGPKKELAGPMRGIEPKAKEKK